MADWDAEDYVPNEGNFDSNRWEGEDEDDNDLGNWDDSEPEEEVKAPSPQVQEPPKKGGKKQLKQVLKEKEEKERLEREKRRAIEAAMTPEEKLAEKLRAQKLAEDSDFELTNEMFASKPVDPNEITLDNFKPTTKEDFRKMADMMTTKLANLESSPHYFFLLDTVMSKAMLTLIPEDLRKLSTSLNVLANEKTKQEKAKKGKKSSKAKLAGATKAATRHEVEDFSNYDEFDDFM